MIAYKFRRLSTCRCKHPSDFVRIMQIIGQKQLYCASWNDLNDASEGHYYRSDKNTPDQVRKLLSEKLRSEKLRLRVCSLCKDFENPLMWAHYAAEFEGIAIELIIPDPCKNGPVVEVRYKLTLPHIEINERFASELAREILSTKLSLWEHEHEVRILHDDKSFKLDRHAVNQVIFGSKVDKSLKERLKAACAKKRIKTCDIKISGGVITI